MPGMVDVLTVDDQASFRDAARELIWATPGFQSAGEASSGVEALRMIGDVNAHLALIDVRMPEPSAVVSTSACWMLG